MSLLERMVHERLRSGPLDKSGKTGPKPRRGENIFPDPTEPRSFEEIIGQDLATDMLAAAVRSSIRSGQRLPHTLLACGSPGVAKSTMARILAYQRRVGLTEVSGQVTSDEALAALKGMKPFDVLLVEEAHRLGRGGEWLLHLMQDGRMVTPAGVHQVPDVTVVATTTDLGRLPQAIISRFRLRPAIVDIDDDSILLITYSFVERMGLTLTDEQVRRVATAACYAPRSARALLDVVAVYISDPEFDGDPVDKALAVTQTTSEGLTLVQQNYLKVLGVLNGGSASLSTLSAMLNEPTLNHIEQNLLRLGLVQIAPGGRRITDRGITTLEGLLDQ